MCSVDFLKFWTDRTGSGRQQLLGLLLAGLVAFALPGAARAQTMKAPDITKVPTLFVVPYAHLDTQWRWEMPQSISEYMLKTLNVNFYLINKYPHYVFNGTGPTAEELAEEKP